MSSNDEVLEAVRSVSRDMDRLFDEMHRGFDEVYRRFDQMHRRFDRINGSLDLIDGHLDRIDEHLDRWRSSRSGDDNIKHLRRDLMRHRHDTDGSVVFPPLDSDDIIEILGSARSA